MAVSKSEAKSAAGGPPADAQHHRALLLVIDAGRTLLENGGEVFRVQQTMQIMAQSLGIGEFNVYVLANGIFVSSRGRRIRTAGFSARPATGPAGSGARAAPDVPAVRWYSVQTH